MKVSAVVSLVIAGMASTSLALAQLEQPPTIELTDADRLVRACVRAEGAGIQCDEDTNMVAGPFVSSVFEQLNGNLGSSGNSQADQNTQISSFSISGSLSVEASADLGGDQGAFIDAGADSELGVTFSIPVDSPYTLSGSFAASGVDGAFCLSGATVSMAGISANGSAFLHGRSFNCESPPEDADFFIVGTAQAGATLTLAVQLSAWPEGGGGFDLLGTGTASINFSLDFGDRDDDGLLDAWEKEGIDIDHDGTPEIDLPGMGANPDKKDLFVEVDVMDGVGFDQGAIDKVILAFAQAPASMVDNPDGTLGIQLHVVVDGDRPAHQPLILLPPGPWPPEYYTIKDSFFGSEDNRNHPAWDDIRRASLLVFRYCLWADTAATPPPDSIQAFGIAEATPSNDFIVAAGDAQSTPYLANVLTDALAGTFMHEFGHTLGLRHGGQDHENNKPNYLSVMNYAYTIPLESITAEGTNVADYWRLDFSRSTMTDLDETELYETLGLGGPSGRFIYYNYADESDPDPVKRALARADRLHVNWNGDENDPDVAPFQLDITRNDASVDPFYDSTLESFTDWDRIWYHLGGTQDFDDRVPWPFAVPVEALEKATIEAFFDVEWIDLTLDDDVIFANGFELGSTTAWSETVP